LDAVEVCEVHLGTHFQPGKPPQFSSKFSHVFQPQTVDPDRNARSIDEASIGCILHPFLRFKLTIELSQVSFSIRQKINRLYPQYLFI